MSDRGKVGLDYYTMDVGFLRDKKIRLLQSEFGASSVIFVLYVLGKAYEGEGYFLTWDRDERLLAADALQKPPTYVDEVLKGCLSRWIFDNRVFQMFSVLTSAGIQRRYVRGCEKRSEIFIFSEYWLLNADIRKDVPPSIRTKITFLNAGGGNNVLNSTGGGNKALNSPGNTDNSPGKPQSKVKESRVKESKVLTPPDGGWGFTDELESALSEWLSYKKENGQPYKATGLKNLIAKVREEAAAHGDKAVADVIRLTMSNDYQGIVWNQLKKASSPNNGTGAVRENSDSIRREMDNMEKYLRKLKGEQENGEL